MRLRGGASVGSFEPATVKASLRAMADLYSLCGIGYWAAYKGILDVVTVRAMSKATYYIFLPALLFISVSRTLATPTHGGFAALAPLPIICAMQNFLGLALAKFALLPAAAVAGDSDDGREMLINIGFGNAGNLPIVLASSLFRSQPDIASTAVSYISFYLLGWSPIFWTLGYSILNPRPTPEKSGKITMTGATSTVGKCLAALQSPAIGRIMSPPILSCVCGGLAGSTPIIKELFISPRSPLQPMVQAFDTLGKAYTPIASLVLAASLYHRPRSPPSYSTSEYVSSEKEQVAPLKMLGAVTLARFVLNPLLCVAMIRLWRRFGGTAALNADPVLLFILLLQSIMPSAQNSIIMLTKDGRVSAAGRLARSLFTIYTAAIFPMAFALALILQYMDIPV
jgi:predicted permease